MSSAAEHNLVAGLIEALPPVGSLFTSVDRRKWRSLADAVLCVLYPDETEAKIQPMAPSAPALPAPAIEEVEAVPVAAGSTKFAKKLAARKAKLGARKQGRPKGSKAAKAAAIEKVAKGPGRVTARDIVLAALASSDGPMTIREMESWAMRKDGLDVSGFLDLRSAIGFQVKRMDQAGEIALKDASIPYRYSLARGRKGGA